MYILPHILCYSLAPQLALEQRGIFTPHVFYTCNLMLYTLPPSYAIRMSGGWFDFHSMCIC